MYFFALAVHYIINDQNLYDIIFISISTIDMSKYCCSFSLMVRAYLLNSIRKLAKFISYEMLP